MLKIKFNKKDKLKGLRLPQKPTSDLAYLCGVFAGDGSISFRKNKNEYSVKCVGNPKDEKPFYDIVISPKFEKTFGFIPKMKGFDCGTTWGFMIFSKALVNYLFSVIGLPLGNKYDNLKIPEIFLSDSKLIINFIKGVFDTDGCMCFKKKYKDYPYYPVISMSSKCKIFTKEIAIILKKLSFKLTETYDYKIKDVRAKRGFTIINRLELNGKKNLILWIKKVGFLSPKHLNKINKYWKEK